MSWQDITSCLMFNAVLQKIELNTNGYTNVVTASTIAYESQLYEAERQDETQT